MIIVMHTPTRINLVTKFGTTVVAKGDIDDLNFIRDTINMWTLVPRECMCLHTTAGIAYYSVANEYIDFSEARRLYEVLPDHRDCPQKLYKPFTSGKHVR